MDEDARERGAGTERLSVLVVGGSRGIGLASAVALRHAGHRVATWSRSAPAEDPSTSGIAGAAVDVREPDAVAAEFTRNAGAGRRPEVLVYSAASVGRGAVGSIGAQTWRDTLEVNAVGAHTVLEGGRCLGRPSRRGNDTAGTPTCACAGVLVHAGALPRVA